MTSPSKEWEKLVISGKLRHGGNPVLRWMASNVAAELDAAGNIKPSKKKSTERIDGIVAGIMGLGRALLRPKFTSIYETRGVLYV
jgi:phage terminase large subunit-like protein